MSAESTLEKMCKIQEKDLENSYFCEDMFSHFNGIKASQKAKEEVIKDFISVTDEIIIIGRYCESMAYVLDFAEEINMEVKYIEDSE